MEKNGKVVPVTGPPRRPIIGCPRPQQGVWGQKPQLERLMLKGTNPAAEPVPDSETQATA